MTQEQLDIFPITEPPGDDGFIVETVRRRAGEMVSGPYRVLVTGSRGIVSDIVGDTLDVVRSWLHPELDMVVVHGNCKDGADRLADDWVIDKQHTPGTRIWFERHTANWKPDGRDGPVDRNAGFKRNTGMVSRRADLCVAFLAPCQKPGCASKPLHATHGAADCSEKAKAAHIPVWRIRVGWDG